MPLQVLVSGRTFEQEFLELLRKQGYEVEFHPEHLAESDLCELIRGKDAFILGGVEFVSAKTIESGSNLKVIAVAAVGYESYVDVQAASNKGIAVTNTPKANARATAEMTIALMTALWRKVPYLNSESKSGHWRDDVVSGTLQGAVIGIVGAGTIGSIVAEIAALGLGMEVLYHSRSVKPQLEEKTGARKVSFEELLRRSDVVSLHVPITNETRGLVDEHELSLMDSRAILVNTARPQVVSPHALLKALSTKSIAGCAMDGYYDEPPVKGSDRYGLLGLSDEVFLLSPHVGYLTYRSIHDMCELATESVIDILQGRSWKHIVNPDYIRHAETESGLGTSG
jgi:lactate dehydrogenase-like 2-hydroxyacid dehydrogenase